MDPRLTQKRRAESSRSAPRKAAPPEAVPPEVPREAAPREAAPPEAVLHNPAPRTAAPRKAAPREAAPREAAPPVRKAQAREPSQAAWVLQHIETRCTLFRERADEAEALLAYRLSYRPRTPAGLLKLTPPEAYLLLFELSPQPDTARQRLRVIDVHAAAPAAGAIDRGHIARLLTGLGASLGTAATPLAASLLGTGLAAIPSAALTASGLIASAFFGKEAVAPAVPFVLGESAFGWRYTRTESLAAPYGILSGSASLVLDRSIRFLNIEVSVLTGPRERLLARRHRVAVEAASEPER